ncbi:sigma-E factor regulatory protein RseB [Rahnella bonaserana]|jgi:sigma-E factor negative regulatory protein RseB|uniref:Sigma-E factor regulatory protein RseB n=1 Tax=Rahnella bonaserana TaxID=2816248 RepID=A0ABS6LU28_9GAMM|nr:sigma-E factor regulatory protein RseB [Rahnella bonaserana]MBU9855317.1 sigma-E factor regulatory protein RseB [Rahnella bonaserana]MCL9643045.1 sigma-E factor regulatory protein RseB [Rahnella victoriana]WHZ39841.1 sigma-E factor regulatory protein RseB [Rahnella bonaserana]
MKQFWFAACLVTGSLLTPSIASADPTSEALLQGMGKASQSLNYEMGFINITKQGIDSFRYRHAVSDQSSLAQLVLMDGPRREIVQRGKDISYFETGLQPFTLDGDHIVDSLPSIVFSDFSLLSKYYDFIAVGRARAADRLSQVIRVVSRDGTRFSYVIWVDEQTKLPMRVDLLDRDGETLEQFRVISFYDGQQVVDVLADLEKASLPPVLSLPASEQVKFGWQVKWLPAGVAEVASSRRNLPNMPVTIESRLYTDGLFSFSVNISATTNGPSEQLIRQGRRTVQTEVRNGNEITVVGELPPSTAKRIADSIVFSAK